LKNDNSITLRSSAVIVDYAAMMKPELTLMSVSTAVAGAYIALDGFLHYLFLIHTFIGTALVGGGAGVMNQYIERRYDACMKRTEHRPLPSGRVQPKDALFFGVMLCAAGLSYLALFTNWAAASLAAITLVIYLAIYTPMKRKTPFATVVGSIPGALPPVIGWTVVQGGVTMEAWSLFYILFFWQTVHFLSLAWMFRNDYSRAGYKLLTVIDPSCTSARRQVLIYSIALVPASLMPTMVGLAGELYFAGALMLSFGMLIMTVHLYVVRTDAAAQRLFYSSLFFLPSLFFLMMV
jgi:heme o synthase